MPIAKLFLGPQDGGQQKFQGEPPARIIVIRPYDEAGDPQDMLEDVYEYIPEWCANDDCPFFHYEYVETTRTKES